MKIEMDVSALRRTSWKEYGMRFLFGGLVALAAGAVGRAYGPVVGGLFLAFPAIFPAAATLIDKHERQKEEASGGDGLVRGAEAAGVDAVGSAIGSLGLVAFGTVVWTCSPHLPHIATFALALTAWVVVCMVGWVIRQRI